MGTDGYRTTLENYRTTELQREMARWTLRLAQGIMLLGQTRPKKT